MNLNIKKEDVFALLYKTDISEDFNKKFAGLAKVNKVNSKEVRFIIDTP